LQRLGVVLQVVEAVLGHISGSRAGIVGVYQRHEFEPEKRQALEAWAGEVARITGRSVVSAVAVASGIGTAHAVSEPVDMQWVKAVGQADTDNSPDPLVAYLKKPGAVQLGPIELRWLRDLLERMQFKRKKHGNWTPLGAKSREEIHTVAAAHVRDLMRTEGLSQAQAIDRVAKIYPDWYAHDTGLSLQNFMKRGDGARTSGKRRRRTQ
jgi:hypothetical protein